ncbi:MAG: putative DNA binding domain-containing protein [Bacteroidales bacterium]|jgi:ATP-dependent DNA helicase RecG|nr:putative DNA binding domain-containing protein [Bacteroidales bacterium]
MDIEELNILLNSETETEVLEFKKAERQYDKDKLGRYFSALSNEANLYGKECAWLLLGVLNDKTIFGTSISDKQLNEYKSEIANHTSPTLSFIKTERIFTEKGKVILLQIPAAPKGQPVSWKGHYYGRDGESLGALNSEEYDRIRNQKVSTDWSAQIISEASIKDLSTEAILKAREQYAEKNPKLKETINNWDGITFLNKAKVCIAGQITNTAILLLAKPESEHYINPAVSKISWILKDRDNIEKDYAHFSCPLLLEVEGVYSKIRNLKYRYLQSGTLFPDEVDQFDPYIIREAIHNCIAHQDYTLGGKINVVEREDGILTFVNSGSFIPGSVEKVIEADAPETEYRNPFLANAMVNLNMIDTIGSGIRKMFVIQKNKYFPLPEYDFSNNKVQVQIIGKVLDENYAKKLALNADLSLQDIILLDKVAKQKKLVDSEIKELRKKKLIEGRSPNFYVSSTIAEVTGEKATYIKQRGFKDDHYKKMILEFIEKYGKATKNDIDNLLMEILPSVLNDKKKANKVRNIIYAMSKKDMTIINRGTRKNPEWIKV